MRESAAFHTMRFQAKYSCTHKSRLVYVRPRGKLWRRPSDTPLLVLVQPAAKGANMEQPTMFPVVIWPAATDLALPVTSSRCADVYSFAHATTVQNSLVYTH